MAKIGYLYTYGDGEIKINTNNENNVSYEIELVNKTVDFLKRIIHKTYRITQVISKYGIVQKITIRFRIEIWKFKASRADNSTTNSSRKTTQADQAMEGFESPSVDNLLKVSGGDLGKSGPKPRVKADAWLQNPFKRSRPAGANRLAQHKIIHMAQLDLDL